MFPLAGKSFPQSSDELVAAIRGKLEEVFKLPKGAGAVKAAGDDYPELKKLTIDLDGASVDAKEPPPKPQPTGKRSEGITVAQLVLTGHPIKYENSKVDIELNAKGVKLDFSKDKSGEPLLVLADAAEGEAEAKVSKADLRALVLAGAAAAAKEQGVNVTDVEIDLTAQGKQSFGADVRVTAKKAFVKGVVHLTGKADIDDDLNATVSNLTCTGEGMVGTMAAGFLKKHIEEFNGRKFPLMAFSLGDVTLRDLKVDVKNGVSVKAKFGSK